MAYLLAEKYLTDSLRADRKVEADRIAAANLLPAWLPKDQYSEDSSRAFQWFKITNDSSYIKKYLRKGTVAKPPVKRDSIPPVQRITWLHKDDLIDPKKTFSMKKKIAEV